MDDLTAIAQLIDGLSLSAVLLWILTIERRDHRYTRETLEAVHKEHKQDLREPEATPE